MSTWKIVVNYVQWIIDELWQLVIFFTVYFNSTNHPNCCRFFSIKFVSKYHFFIQTNATWNNILWKNITKNKWKQHMKTKDSTEKQNLGWSTAHAVHIWRAAEVYQHIPLSSKPRIQVSTGITQLGCSQIWDKSPFGLTYLSLSIDINTYNL